MKKYNSPAKLLFGFLGIATFASLVGTVSGTLAWYAYSTRSTISYSGTSVTSTVQLEIGLKSDTAMPAKGAYDNNEDYSDFDRENLEIFWNSVVPTNIPSDPNHFYYFVPAGSGLESPVINAYLRHQGHSTNYLVPVTSGAFDIRENDRPDGFVPKKSPTFSHPENTIDADKGYYAVIPFVFRVKRSDSVDPNQYEPNRKLWLTDVTASAYDESVDGNAFKAVRMFIDRDDSYYTQGDFILNPSSNSEIANENKTYVGGVLDLNRDGYYDYDDNGEEILYGACTRESGAISDTGFIIDGEEKIANINDTAGNPDTFTAKHRENILYYENYNKVQRGEAKYETLKTIHPHIDREGVLSEEHPDNPTSVCITGGPANLAELTITVYLEGWDHSIVDEELEHNFNLGLTFEINRLGAGE